jgi:hypothetical protein
MYATGHGQIGSQGQSRFKIFKGNKASHKIRFHASESWNKTENWGKKGVKGAKVVGNFELTERPDHSCPSTSTPPPRRWQTRSTLRAPTCCPSARPTDKTSTRF